MTSTTALSSAALLSVPKAAPANSFVLHAPLELMARIQLLRFLPEANQRAALDKIEWLAAEYQSAGASVAEPSAVAGPPDVAALRSAIADGDQDLVDSMAANWLPQWSAREVVGALGDAVVPSLAAAGHAPIGLSLLLRDTQLPTTLLRGPLRSLSAQPDWRITWHEPIATHGDATGLYQALRAAPQLGRPGSDFIYPLMSQAVDSGEAERLLAPVLADRYDVAAALHCITRVAAWSMLHDDQSQAPYGWTHALTMPQAVLSLVAAGVRARAALAVAATFSLGFRLAHGIVELPPVIEPVVCDISFAQSAAAVCTHEDAHLVKFTLACIHAAAADPEFAGLYRAAAAHLVEWWRDAVECQQQ